MNDEAALHKAAKATLARIAEDRERVSAPGVKEILQHIADHVFNENFGSSELRRRFRDQDMGLFAAFGAEIGQPVAKYISGARLETAARLLRDTELSVWQIGELVGYRETATFRSSFKRWFGMRPKEFRDSAHHVGERLGWPEEEVLSFRFWNQLERGELLPSRRSLIEWYRTVCSPAQDEEQSPPRATTKRDSDRDALAQSVAEEVWQELALLSPAAQHDLLRNEIFCSSRSLFDFLSKKSRDEGRRDRQRGVELAELALASVEASAPLLGATFYDVHPLALARVGNALRLAGNFPAAEKAFARAEASAGLPRATVPQSAGS